MANPAGRSALARKIITERERRQWTQADLAVRAHVSRSWVAAVESGTQPTPRLGFLQRVAEVLSLDLSALVADDLDDVLDRGGDAAAIHRKLDRIQRASASILYGLTVYADVLSDALPLTDEQRSRLRDLFSEGGEDADPPAVQ